MDVESLSSQERDDELRPIFLEADQRNKRRKLYNLYDKVYDPRKPNEPGVYPWQVEFHNAGAEFNQRCLMAANQVGKSRTAAAEVAMHLTGEYPEWWKGKRFNHGVKVWIGSTTNEKSRDVMQEALLGPIGQFGTGWVPAWRLIGKPKFRQAGIPDVVDIFYVMHITGEMSKCQFKTYEQGRESWQGTGQHVIECDEEPPADIWSEALTRTVATGGIMMLTFTPLLGVSDVVMEFRNPKVGSKKYLKNVTWDDAPHLSEEKKAELRATYGEHELDTRTRGMPLMARGLVFPVADQDLLIDPFKIPDWWPRVNGHDFGIDHPGAGAFLAHDRDSDTIYLYDCYKMSNQTAIYHAKALQRHGSWIPIAWPRDGLQRDKGAGQALRDVYRAADSDLYLMREHAHYDNEKGEHVEPGLDEMLEYMKTGKFKVFRGICESFMEEKRLYHRDEKGMIVKLRDDIISAVRYAFVMRRYAVTKPKPSLRNKAPTRPML